MQRKVAALIMAALAGEATALSIIDDAQLPLCKGTTTSTFTNGRTETRAFEALIVAEDEELSFVRGDIERFAAVYIRDRKAERLAPEIKAFWSLTGSARLYRDTNRAEFVHLHTQPGNELRRETTKSTCFQGGTKVSFW